MKKSYIDIEKVLSLDQNDRDIILSLYRDMLHHSNIGEKDIAESYFHSLDKAGYLKDLRSEKIKEIVE